MLRNETFQLQLSHEEKKLKKDNESEHSDDDSEEDNLDYIAELKK